MIKGGKFPELGLEANELQGLNDISQEYIIAFVRGPRDVRLKLYTPH